MGLKFKKTLFSLVLAGVFFHAPLKATETTVCSGVSDSIAWKVTYTSGMPTTYGCLVYVWEAGDWELASGWVNCTKVCQDLSSSSTTTLHQLIKNKPAQN